MSNFCVATVQVDERMRGDHGVLHAHSLFLSSQAREMAAQLMDEAEQNREALLLQTQEQSEQMLADAQQAGEDAVEQAQTRVIEQANDLFATLDSSLAQVNDGIRPLVVSLALELFDRLVLESTPEERAAGAYRRLLTEVPLKLIDAVLKVHPEELAIYEAFVPAPRWALQPDPSIARGACRVDANSGEWSAGFDLAAKALRAAFVHSTEPGVVDEVAMDGEGEEEFDPDSLEDDEDQSLH
jgi:flagellar biosynthesis/type III secretory pathway protein FliH